MYSACFRAMKWFMPMMAATIAFTIKHMLLNPILRSQGNWKQQTVWDDGITGVGDLMVTVCGLRTVVIKREMMTLLPIVKAKIGPVTGMKKEHGKHPPSHRAAASLSNPGPNPWSHPKDLPLDKDVGSSVKGGGGRVWDGFPTLTTVHRTNTPAQV